MTAIINEPALSSLADETLETGERMRTRERYAVPVYMVLYSTSESWLEGVDHNDFPASFHLSRYAANRFVGPEDMVRLAVFECIATPPLSDSLDHGFENYYRRIASSCGRLAPKKLTLLRLNLRVIPVAHTIEN